MNSRAILFCLLPLSLCAAARADTIAQPVTLLGKDASALFANAYDSCGQKTGCNPHRERSAKLDDIEVQVMRARANPNLAAVLVKQGDRLFVAAKILLAAFDCGAGRCIDEKIASLKVERAADIIWIDAAVDAKVTRGRGESATSSQYHLVIGCQLAASPACGTIQAGSAFKSATLPLADRSIVFPRGL